METNVPFNSCQSLPESWEWKIIHLWNDWACAPWSNFILTFLIGKLSREAFHPHEFKRQDKICRQTCCCLPFPSMILSDHKPSLRNTLCYVTSDPQAAFSTCATSSKETLRYISMSWLIQTCRNLLKCGANGACLGKALLECWSHDEHPAISCFRMLWKNFHG